MLYGILNHAVPMDEHLLVRILLSRGTVEGMLDPDPGWLERDQDVAQVIEVEVGIDEQICKEHNRVLFDVPSTSSTLDCLKAGISLDGKIANILVSCGLRLLFASTCTSNSNGRWILVGKNTIQDNPSLTTRLLEEDLSKTPQQKIHQPIPIVLTTAGIESAAELKILQHPKRPIVISSEEPDQTATFDNSSFS